MRSLAYLGALAATALAVAVSCGNDFVFISGTTTAAGGSAGAGGSSSASTSSSTSTGAGGSAGSGGAACHDFNIPCATCELEQCPDLYCRCFDSEGCIGLAWCIGNCPAGYNPCVQSCYSNSPTGISDAALVVECAATLCQAHCPGFGSLPPCNLCMFEGCPGEMNACLADPDCAALLYCVNGCTDQTCATSCVADHGGVTLLVSNLSSCMTAACGTPCEWVLN